MKIRQKLQKVLGGKQDRMIPMPGVLGDGTAVVEVPDMKNWVYCRMNGSVTQVYNVRVSATPDLQVWVGTDASSPGVMQVLGVRAGWTYEADNAQAVQVPPHGEEHSWEGDDPTPIWPQQIMAGRVSAYQNQSVIVYPILVWASALSQHVLVSGLEPVDLYLYTPVTIGKALYVLCTINTSGALVWTVGSEWDVALSPNYAGIPTPPVGSQYVLGAVRLYYGQDAIVEALAGTDIIDLRFMMGELDGDVFGPELSVDGDVAIFDSVTGKLLKDTQTINVSFSASTPGTGGLVEAITVGGVPYWMHTFAAGGTFTPPTGGVVADVLVVAGGGSGGYGAGGGGGGGGVIHDPVLVISSAVTVTIGAGGLNNGGGANNGGDSSIGTLVVATGGGAGSDNNDRVAGSGGSGGGAGDGGAFRIPGTGIAGQGHDGGVWDGGPSRGSGGGGAGEVGHASASGNGDGGAGILFDKTGLYYGGGGGSNSGVGGLGGGGDGGNPGTDGEDGTGGGGGGCGYYVAGAGGAGIVYIYYKKKALVTIDGELLVSGDQRAPDFVSTRSAVVTRDGDGRIASITKTGGRVITLTRNADGYIESASDTINTWTIDRDANNILEGVTVT